MKIPIPTSWTPHWWRISWFQLPGPPWWKSRFQLPGSLWWISWFQLPPLMKIQIPTSWTPLMKIQISTSWPPLGEDPDSKYTTCSIKCISFFFLLCHLFFTIKTFPSSISLHYFFFIPFHSFQFHSFLPSGELRFWCCPNWKYLFPL